MRDPRRERSNDDCRSKAQPVPGSRGDLVDALDRAHDYRNWRDYEKHKRSSDSCKPDQRPAHEQQYADLAQEKVGEVSHKKPEQADCGVPLPHEVELPHLRRHLVQCIHERWEYRHHGDKDEAAEYVEKLHRAFFRSHSLGFDAVDHQRDDPQGVQSQVGEHCKRSRRIRPIHRMRLQPLDAHTRSPQDPHEREQEEVEQLQAGPDVEPHLPELSRWREHEGREPIPRVLRCGNAAMERIHRRLPDFLMPPADDCSKEAAERQGDWVQVSKGKDAEDTAQKTADEISSGDSSLCHVKFLSQ